MKVIPFIRFSLCFAVVLGSYAQTTKTFNEGFDVNKDVEVVLNTSNAEIIIETWNKDRVEVEASVSIEIENEELAKEILDKFEFEALGNSKKVEITAGRSNPFFVARNGRFVPDNDVQIFTSRPGTNFPAPPALPELPEMPEMGFDFHFDMEKFNEEGRAYIIKFREDARNMVNDSNFRKEMKEWKMKFKEEMIEKGLRDSIKVYTYELRNNLRPVLREMRENLKVMRDAANVKKTITIKMPKDAKLKLDVKRSQLKIASLNQIDANLNYSGLHIDKLTGDSSTIRASYSTVEVDNAKALKLYVKYAKNVQLGTIVDLESISKTSNLNIKNIKNSAFIEGSFGELVVEDINSGFKFIDITLRNSNAKLNLPETVFNFYINSKASDVDLDAVLDYKVNQAFDTKIYQNKTPVSSEKSLNIKADYSNFQVY
jgi:hypothetical protein